VRELDLHLVQMACELRVKKLDILFFHFDVHARPDCRSRAGL
jgi:hypothetical protein